MTDTDTIAPESAPEAPGPPGPAPTRRHRPMGRGEVEARAAKGKQAR